MTGKTHAIGSHRCQKHVPVDKNCGVQIARLRVCAEKSGGAMIKVLSRKVHSVETRSDFLSSNFQKHGPVRGPEIVAGANAIRITVNMQSY